jgi:hypothetical protein
MQQDLTLPEQSYIVDIFCDIMHDHICFVTTYKLTTVELALQFCNYLDQHKHYVQYGNIICKDIQHNDDNDDFDSNPINNLFRPIYDNLNSAIHDFTEFIEHICTYHLQQSNYLYKDDVKQADLNVYLLFIKQTNMLEMQKKIDQLTEENKVLRKQLHS